MNKLTDRDLQRLESVAPALVNIVKEASFICDQPFMVVEGLRSTEQMLINYGRGRTADECLKKSVPSKYANPLAAKVTWLANPLMSNHRKMPDGFGHAVDLGALIGGHYDGNNRSAYDHIATAMLQVAANMGISIRWGADWDQDGKYHEPGETDMGHFELR